MFVAVASRVVVGCFFVVACAAATAAWATEESESVSPVLALAEEGDAEAQYEAGLHYQCGVGVGQNRMRAAMWFGRAIEQGHAKARSAFDAMADGRELECKTLLGEIGGSDEKSAGSVPDTARNGPRWKFIGCQADELDDSKFCKTFSPATHAATNKSSRIGYECGEDSKGEAYELAFLSFNYLNLQEDGRIGSFEHHNVKVRWDKEPATYNSFRNQSGASILFWDVDSTQQNAISRFQSGNRFVVRLNYYSDGPVTFSYSLAGAKAAIARARKECGL